jgi:hypothetical protein
VRRYFAETGARLRAIMKRMSDMAKKKSTAKRKFGNPVSWAAMCRTLRIFGYMRDTSKAEAFRINKLLKNRIEQGNAERVGRGRYRQIYA